MKSYLIYIICVVGTCIHAKADEQAILDIAGAVYRAESVFKSLGLDTNTRPKHAISSELWDTAKSSNCSITRSQTETYPNYYLSSHFIMGDQCALGFQYEVLSWYYDSELFTYKRHIYLAVNGEGFPSKKSKIIGLDIVGKYKQLYVHPDAQKVTSHFIGTIDHIDYGTIEYERYYKSLVGQNVTSSYITTYTFENDKISGELTIDYSKGFFLNGRKMTKKEIDRYRSHFL